MGGFPSSLCKRSFTGWVNLMGFREIHGFSWFHSIFFWDIRYLFGDTEIWGIKWDGPWGFRMEHQWDFTQEIPPFPGDVLEQTTHHGFTFMRIQWDYDNYED
jgi:hypothetical protein